MPLHSPHTFAKLGIAAALAGAAFAAHSQTDAAARSPDPAASTTGWTELSQRVRLGDATTALLELQRSGARASPTQRPVLGEVAGRNYTRYLDSFKYPLPESFEATVVRGNGSTGTGGAAPR